MAGKIKPRAERVAPTHPGAVMREILEETLGLSVADAAKAMGVSRQTLYEVLRGENRLTAELALRFATLAGADPSLYLHMQDELDLWTAERKLKNELPKIVPAKRAAG
jgi:addiction module HigA family antidote